MEEVGAALGLTRQRVQQIESLAMHKLGCHTDWRGRQRLKGMFYDLLAAQDERKRWGRRR